jgi:hypothetical protein
MTVGGSLLLGGAIFFAAASNRGDGDRKPGQQSVRVVHNVKWTITSDPPGATVLRALDQSEIGRTPWHTTQPSSNGQLIIILRLPGYADRVVTMDQSANAQVKETLSPLATNAPPPTTSEPTTTPPPPPAVDPAAAAANKRGKKGKPTGKGEGGSATPDKTPATPSTTATPSPPVTPAKPKDETSNGRIQVVD